MEDPASMFADVRKSPGCLETKGIAFVSLICRSSSSNSSSAALCRKLATAAASPFIQTHTKAELC